MDEVERVAARMFVEAARGTLYGSWEFSYREVEDMGAPMEKAHDVFVLTDALYAVGHPWVLDVDVHRGVMSLVVSDHFTEGADPRCDGYDAAWDAVERLERMLDDE